jgi:hypothetical protein
MLGKARFLLSFLLAAGFAQLLPAADSTPAAANLSATQIIERHVAARGGLAAWRGVQTLTATGKIDAGTGDSIARSERVARGATGANLKQAHRAAVANPQAPTAQVQLPFRLEMKRPHKSRLEIDFAGKTAVQVYDGAHGWKLRPYLNRDDVEPFTDTEAKAQAERADLEDPLIDYAAKGSQVALEGVESIDGHKAYKLKLTLKGGDVQHIWIDSQSFLDVKLEGLPRRMDGRMRSVWIYQRDFRSVQGVMVPYLYETALEGSPGTHKMIVESVSINRPLDDSRFAKPVPVADSPAVAATTAKPAANANPEKAK